MQNAYKFKNRVSDPDILLSPDTLLSPTKGGALSRAHGRPTITECEISQSVSYQLKSKAQLIDLYVFDIIYLAD